MLQSNLEVMKSCANFWKETQLGTQQEYVFYSEASELIRVNWPVQLFVLLAQKMRDQSDQDMFSKEEFKKKSELE